MTSSNTCSGEREVFQDGGRGSWGGENGEVEEGEHITGVQGRKEERNILFEIDSVNRNHTFFPKKEHFRFQR